MELQNESKHTKIPDVRKVVRHSKILLSYSGANSPQLGNFRYQNFYCTKTSIVRSMSTVNLLRVCQILDFYSKFMPAMHGRL